MSTDNIDTTRKACPYSASQKPTLAVQKKTVVRQPITVSDLSFIAENLDVYRACCDWMAHYLTQPHPDLGRGGSVCPFAAPALAKDTLKIAVVRLSSGDRRSQIINAITGYRDLFLSLGGSPDIQQLHAILVLFPDVAAHETADLIDGVKEELKAAFVSQGLMLGEFHADNMSPGLHNPEFHPLRSAIPMLAIRRMVVTDYVFLDRPDYDASTRLRYLETYLQVSGMGESKMRKDIEQVVSTLRAGLRQ